jgi:hypothetical protein
MLRHLLFMLLHDWAHEWKEPRLQEWASAGKQVEQVAALAEGLAGVYAVAREQYQLAIALRATHLARLPDEGEALLCRVDKALGAGGALKEGPVAALHLARCHLLFSLGRTDEGLATVREVLPRIRLTEHTSHKLLFMTRCGGWFVEAAGPHVEGTGGQKAYTAPGLGLLKEAEEVELECLRLIDDVQSEDLSLQVRLSP